MADYRAHYARMTDGELLRLAAQEGDLVPEAKVALEEEIATRNLSTEQEQGTSAWEEPRAENTEQAESKGSGFGRAAFEIFVFFIISFALAAVVSQFVGSNNRAQEALGQLSVYFAMLLWGIYRTLAKIRYREVWVAAVGIILLAVFLGPSLNKSSDRKATLNEWSRDLSEFHKARAPIAKVIEEAYAVDINLGWGAYERRLNKLEPILPDWEAHLDRYEELLAKFSKSPFASRDEFGQMISNGKLMLTLDREATRLLRQEIAYGRTLLKLPRPQRDQFWDENILPLLERQDAIVTQQLEIIRKVESTRD